MAWYYKWASILPVTAFWKDSEYCSSLSCSLFSSPSHSVYPLFSYSNLLNFSAASTLPVTASVKDSEQWTSSVDWNNKENQRAYLDWLGHQFSYKQLSDWYGVKLEDFSATKGGQALLKLYSHPSIVCSPPPLSLPCLEDLAATKGGQEA